MIGAILSTIVITDNDSQRFKQPVASIPGICISTEGKIYITDDANSRIMLILDGTGSTIAGCGEQGHQDGNAENAKFNKPTGICISYADKIYVSDTGNHRIRMIYDGFVSTIAGNGQKGHKDGKAEDAMFFSPTGICVSNRGILYVADTKEGFIRMISNGMVSTIAGSRGNKFRNGLASDATFYGPYDVFTLDDYSIYVAYHGNNCIRSIRNRAVTTFAGSARRKGGDRDGADAKFNGPRGICMSDPDHLFVADQYNCSMRMISNDIVSTIGMFGTPLAIRTHEDDIYMTESGEFLIRKVSGLINSPPGYFELSSLIQSKALSDLTLTVNNHQFHLHSIVVQTLCPMVIKYKSIIEDAKISHESLQTMFEMVYSNTTKIRKHRDQYEMKDLTHLIELIWLFDSFEMQNESFRATCIEQFKAELKYLMKKEENKSTIEALKTELIHRTEELIELAITTDLKTNRLAEINHLINQLTNKDYENLQLNTNQ